MKRTLVSVLCSLSLMAHAAAPASKIRPTGPKPAPDGARFLFVVDTSASMKPIDLATRQTVFDLIFSGVDGYMRTGDTFGVWTYDEQIGAGRYPMKVWDADNLVALASQVTMFIREQEFHGNNRIEELMMKIAAISRAATNVNVLLISDGDTKMQGTPADAEINAAYQQRNKERKSAKKPFITTLVVEGGRIVNGFVTLPGEPVPLPARPAPVAQAAPSSSPGAKSNVADSRTGKTTETNARPAGAVVTPSGASPAAAASATAPTSAVSKSENTGALPTATATPGSGSTSGEAAPTDAASASTNRPRKVVQITTLPSRPSPKPEEPAEATAAVDPKPQANSKPTNAVFPAASLAASSTNPAPLHPTLAASEALASTPPPVKSNDSALERSRLVAVVAPAPVVVAAREPSAPSTSAPASTLAVTTVPVPVSPGLGAIPTLIIGGILLAMALFLLGVAFRRMHREPRGSFITQSMHRR